MKALYEELDEYQKILKNEIAQSYANEKGVDLDAAFDRIHSACVLERQHRPRRLLGLLFIVIVGAFSLGLIFAFVSYKMFSSMYISVGLGVATIFSVTGIPFGRFYIIDIYKEYWEQRLRAKVSTEITLFRDIVTLVDNWGSLDDLRSNVQQRAQLFMIIQSKFDQQRTQAGRDAAKTVQLGVAYLSSESLFEKAFDQALALGVRLDKGQLLEQAHQWAAQQLNQKK